MRLRVEGQIACGTRPRSPQLHAHVDVGPGTRSLDDGVGVEHAVQPEVLRHCEPGKAVELEPGDHEGRVNPSRRRLHLRLEADASVLADELDGLEHERVAEVDARVVREAQRVSRIGDEEVGEAQAVLVVVDLRVPGELDRAVGDSGIDAHVRQRPLQRHVDVRRPEIDRACREPPGDESQRAVRPLERPAQVAVDSESVRVDRSGPPQPRRAQTHRGVGRTRRTGHTRDQMRGAGDRERWLA